MKAEEIVHTAAEMKNANKIVVKICNDDKQKKGWRMLKIKGCQYDEKIVDRC